ncbi:MULTISPECIES: GNAT family N-acetyltransferase [Rahnella]|jgi:predicted N-acetyltransferase YhbS|uniref:GNAT family N-acetyltransferase n=1 Tax=Rahnella sp. (strain Y9602) TaxID=2703885 RepID=A0ABW6C7T9_RAHSY|nr:MULTISPECIES: GNAT family N-acetyltransferase [Rahnella]AYA05801.1 GNAT family N-acetyltransferase [Rahnella aquatilis]AZP41041.1 GNAT family N-acetyltransferase [Rahnella aquatilis]AZP45382.1 GNAT family N-acetyltransferase [Rahnella aquatilis]AZP49752.1 GNAT family N-acetyltransferase [Rahnella aquatilis]MBU9866477.1 GNAT family N-acetyltransferase [Rahnella aceris]
MKIINLSERPEFQDAVTDWLWQAFGSENSREFFASVVRSSLSGADLPQTFIALEGDRLAGTVGLWRCDLISRQDLTPWLAALYVDENFRSCGLGQQLQAFVLEQSRRSGFCELYLYAEFTGYYERFGWKYIGDALDYPDKPVHLFHQHL